jgi:hypothetical protein
MCTFYSKAIKRAPVTGKYYKQTASVEIIIQKRVKAPELYYYYYYMHIFSNLCSVCIVDSATVKLRDRTKPSFLLINLIRYLQFAVYVTHFTAAMPSTVRILPRLLAGLSEIQPPAYAGESLLPHKKVQIDSNGGSSPGGEWVEKRN